MGQALRKEITSTSIRLSNNLDIHIKISLISVFNYRKRKKKESHIHIVHIVNDFFYYYYQIIVKQKEICNDRTYITIIVFLIKKNENIERNM